MDDSIHSVALGEQASLDELWLSLRRDMRRRGVDDHVADDVVQETWLRMRRRPPSQDRPLRPWVLVVGLRILSELRRRDLSRTARERRVARRDEAELATPGGEDSRILRMVAGLPEPYREVVTLRYVEDLEIEEISRRLERPQATVRSQLRRGLDRLRQRLDADGERRRGARRPAGSLLAWLRGLIPEGRAGKPALACLGIASAVVLVALLAPSRRSELEAGELVAARSLSPED